VRKRYLYILASKPYGTLYTGVTSDLPERLQQHRAGIGSAFTKRYGVTRLVYYEVHDLVTAAIQRETSIKRWKHDWKIALIEKLNPEWKELDYTLVCFLGRRRAPDGWPPQVFSPDTSPTGVRGHSRHIRLGRICFEEAVHAVARGVEDGRASGVCPASDARGREPPGAVPAVRGSSCYGLQMAEAAVVGR
jgi:putative endonuclease